MKVCLTNRQTDEYLAKADEIRVEPRDYKQIFDLLDKYPKADIIYDLGWEPDERIIQELETLCQMSSDRLIMRIFDWRLISWCKEHKVRYFYFYPCKTIEELRAYRDLGCAYAYITAPLTHQLTYVHMVNIPVRMIPNLCYLDGIPRINGWYGDWVRPEDMEAYSFYIDAIEFADVDLRKEQALYRIYIEQKAWPGELNMIINGLQTDAINRMIDSSFSSRRMNCGMLCQNGWNKCKICNNMLGLANASLPSKVQAASTQN